MVLMDRALYWGGKEVWVVLDKKEGLWRQATVVCAVPPAEDEPLGEWRFILDTRHDSWRHLCSFPPTDSSGREFDHLKLTDAALMPEKDDPYKKWTAPAWFDIVPEGSPVFKIKDGSISVHPYISEEIVELRSLYRVAQETIAALTSDLAASQAESAKKSLAIASLESQLSQEKADRAAQVSDLNDQLDVTHARNAALEKDNKELQATLDDLRRVLNEVQEENNKLRIRLKLMTDELVKVGVYICIFIYIHILSIFISIYVCLCMCVCQSRWVRGRARCIALVCREERGQGYCLDDSANTLTNTSALPYPPTPSPQIKALCVTQQHDIDEKARQIAFLTRQAADLAELLRLEREKSADLESQLTRLQSQHAELQAAHRRLEQEHAACGPEIDRLRRRPAATEAGACALCEELERLVQRLQREYQDIWARLSALLGALHPRVDALEQRERLPSPTYAPSPVPEPAQTHDDDATRRKRATYLGGQIDALAGRIAYLEELVDRAPAVVSPPAPVGLVRSPDFDNDMLAQLMEMVNFLQIRNGEGMWVCFCLLSYVLRVCVSVLCWSACGWLVCVFTLSTF